MSIATLASKVVFALHLFAMHLIVFGWALPAWFLPIHLVGVPLTIMQWWLNQNQCVLTQLQYILEGRVMKSDEQGNFIKSLCEKLGLSLSAKSLLFITYAIMLLSFSLSLYRYIHLN